VQVSLEWEQRLLVAEKDMPFREAVVQGACDPQRRRANLADTL
jgi:hypothetical protein